MRSLMLVVLMSWLLAGCASDEEPRTGVLVVPFELGNQRTCEELGIVAVRAELDGGDFVEEADCEAGQVRFAHLMPARYEVVLYGLDADDQAVMDSLANGPRGIHVVGNDTTVVFDPPLGLTSAPAKLELRWSFGFATCEGAGIEGFSIAAWRADGSALLMETDLPCDMPGEGRDQYREVPDVERELSGEELGEVEIQAHDEKGFPIGEAATFKFTAPGAGGEVQLSLECDTGGCNGSGKPDEK
jgi:hypothetical protein